MRTIVGNNGNKKIRHGGSVMAEAKIMKAS